MLKEEVEASVKSLKIGKSPGVDNVPSELLKCGGEASNKGPDSSLPEGLKGEEMAKGMYTVIGDTNTQERKSQTVPKLQDHKPDQPSQQGYAPSDPQPVSEQG